MITAEQKLSLQVKDLGIIDYDQATMLQKQYVQAVLDSSKQSILLCEHEPVLTLGRLAKKEHILMSKETLEKRKVKVRPIDRGGDITLHAPGQLVIYPILDLGFYGKDLHEYLRTLEQVAIDLLGDFDIVGYRFSGQTGVWAGAKKIASIGIGVRKWITYHGLAVNVNTDLSHFSMIRPCGLDVQMTSMCEIKGKKINMADVKVKLIKHFCRHFNAIDQS